MNLNLVTVEQVIEKHRNTKVEPYMSYLVKNQKGEWLASQVQGSGYTTYFQDRKNRVILYVKDAKEIYELPLN